MQTNILWSGIEYYSMENCLVETGEQGSFIHSMIIGYYEEKIYQVEYRICTNGNWETLSVELTARHSNRQQTISLTSDGKGNWLMNGKKETAFEGCMDVDIPLTPFTNTLPINRLQLKKEEEQNISVIYLDMLEWKIYPVRQKYKRLSENRYHYENIPNDFEADIEVDERGLVVNYPQLFKRAAGLQASYQVNEL